MKFTPLRISLIYFGFALVWITTTDQVLDWWLNDSSLLSIMQTIKGFFYISITAIALFIMIKSYEKYLNRNRNLLKKQEKRLNMALESARMATWEYIPDTDRYLASDNHNRLFGYPDNEQMTLQKVINRVHYEDSDNFKKMVNEALKKGTLFNLTYKITLPNGRKRWFWTKGEVGTPPGKPKTISGVTIDITENKKLEAELSLEKERLEVLFNRIPVLINIYNNEQQLMSYNSYHEKILGWTYDDLKKNSLLELCYPDPEYRKKVVSDIIQWEKGWTEYKVQTKNKGERIQMWCNIKLSDDTFVGVGYDVTEERTLEQKIKTEREELQQIFDSIPVFINLHNSKKHITHTNQYFEETFGAVKEDETYIDILKRITDEDTFKAAQKKINHPTGDWVDFELSTKNGTKIYTTWTNIPLSEEKAIGIGIDISERITLEQSIKESQERLQLTTKSANVGLWEWHPQTGVVILDEIWANLVGYTKEELEPISIETWNKLVHPDDLKLFENTVDQYFEGKTDTYECEIRMKHKQGHWVWILDRGKAIERNSNGIPTKMAGTHVDITDRVLAERENKILANVYRRSNTALGVSNHKTGNLERVNQAFADLFGYKVEEMIGMNTEHLYAKTILQSPSNPYNELETIGETTFETNLVTKNKSEFSAIVNLSLFEDAENKSQLRISTVQDITHIKQQQAELQRSRDRLFQVQQIARLGYWTLRPDINEFWWSDIMYVIFGYDNYAFTPTIDAYINITHPDDKHAVQKAINEFKDNEAFQITHRIIKPNGDIGYVQVRAEKIFDDFEQRWVINGSTLDITEIKEIEKELEQQQKRFEIAANISSDVIWEWNPNTNTLWWGDGIENVLGYTADQYKNDPGFWQKRIAEEDRDRIVKSMEKAEKTGATSWEEEYWFLDARNIKRRVSDSALIIRDEQNNIVRIIGAMVDKTKELEYRELLKHQSRKFEMIAKSANDVLYEWNLQTNEVWWSEGWQSKFNFKKEDIEPSFKWWSENLHPDYRQKILNSINTAIADKKDSWYEYYKFKNGKGDYSIVIDKGFFLKNDGDLTYMVGTISDITEEVHAREELKASEEQYRLLFEQSPLLMYIYDPKTLHIVTANVSAIHKYGYSLDELKKMRIDELHPAENQHSVRSQIAESLKKERTGFDTLTQLTKTGEKIISEISGTNIYYEGKKQRLVVAKDVTEQKKAEEKAISAIIDGEERERKRIAKELHDGLGQYLSASNMNLKAVYEDLPNIPEKLERNFKTGLELLNTAISETRNISQNLLPKAIQDYGLELAVESLINHLKNNSNISFTLYRNLGGIQIPEQVQINLYRILQEGLNNAMRHGKPTKIDIQLVHSKNEILMVIEDNGIGFDIDNISGEGLGLRSMKTRVGAMSANLDITSSRDKGTIISVIVPV